MFKNNTFKQHIPNALTILRLLLSFVVFGLLLAGEGWLALWIGLVSAGTDLLDGYLARKWKVQSDFGSRYDPLVDKIAILLPLGFFTAYFGINILYFLVIITREIVITLVRERVYMIGKKMPADILGKIKTNFQFALVVIGTLYYIRFIQYDLFYFQIMYFVVVIITAWSGFSYLHALSKKKN